VPGTIRGVDQLKLDRKRSVRPSLSFTDEPSHRDLHRDGRERDDYGYVCDSGCEWLDAYRTRLVDLQLEINS